MKNFYKNLADSPNYREKEQVENLVEKYLQNPHQYPSSNNINMSPSDKNKL